MSVSSSAFKRLIKDWKDLQIDPVPFVAAQPDESNVFSWHCNLFPQTGPYAGLVFHCILKFPQDYPSSPPKVLLCTSIPHPNIFEQWYNTDNGYPYICLDLLKEESSREPYSGWSSAYSVGSILMQLSAFIFDSNVPQSHGMRSNYASQSQIQACIRKATAFVCRECHHSFLQPIPTQLLPIQSNTSSTLIVSTRNSILNRLDSALTQHWLQFLNVTDLRSCSRLNRQHANLIRTRRLLARKQLMCFHTRQELNHEIVLGFGFNVEYHEPNSDRYRTTTAVNTTREIKSCTAVFDLLSYQAYAEEEVRVGIWKEPFEYFLPLMINQTHACRALPILEQTICALYPAVRQNRALMGSKMLFIITNLMNSTIVSVMKSSESSPVGGRDYDSDDDDSYYGSAPAAPAPFLTLFASEKAMMAYSNLHHLLIGIALRYPSVAEECDLKLKRFMQDPQRRSKSSIPNLGELLVYLAISNSTSWLQIAPAFISEILNRQVLWILRKSPELLHTHGSRAAGRCYRLRTSFHESLTSLRLVAFQVYFLRAIRPDHRVTLPAMNAIYNQRLGMPRAGLSQQLQKACQKILAMRDYDEWFARLGLEIITPAQQEQMLIQAITESARLRYHHPNRIPHTPVRSSFIRCNCAAMDGQVYIANGKTLCKAYDRDLYNRKSGYHLDMLAMEDIDIPAVETLSLSADVPHVPHRSVPPIVIQHNNIGVGQNFEQTIPVRAPILDDDALFPTLNSTATLSVNQAQRRPNITFNPNPPIVPPPVHYPATNYRPPRPGFNINNKRTRFDDHDVPRRRTIHQSPDRHTRHIFTTPTIPVVHTRHNNRATVITTQATIALNNSYESLLNSSDED